MILYHVSCSDFGTFNGDQIAFFAKTKEDSVRFHKTWGKTCKDASQILYECKVDMGKIFDPSNLDKSELAQIEKMVNDVPNKELWGSLADLRDDYPELTDLEYTLDILSGTENWTMMESGLFVDWMRKNKYDTFIIDEYDFKDETVGVLNTDNIEILRKTSRQEIK